MAVSRQKNVSDTSGNRSLILTVLISIVLDKNVTPLNWFLAVLRGK